MHRYPGRESLFFPVPPTVLYRTAHLHCPDILSPSPPSHLKLLLPRARLSALHPFPPLPTDSQSFSSPRPSAVLTAPIPSTPTQGTGHLLQVQKGLLRHLNIAISQYGLQGLTIFLNFLLLLFFYSYCPMVFLFTIAVFVYVY